MAEAGNEWAKRQLPAAVDRMFIAVERADGTVCLGMSATENTTGTKFGPSLEHREQQQDKSTG